MVFILMCKIFAGGNETVIVISTKHNMTWRSELLTATRRCNARHVSAAPMVRIHNDKCCDVVVIVVVVVALSLSRFSI